MARYFRDARTDYLHYLVAPITAYPLTMAVWGYDDDDELNDRCLIQYQDESAADRYLRLSVGDDANNAVTTMPAMAAVSASGLSANASKATSPQERVQNRWHHWAGTFASGSRFGFLDGRKGTENTVAGDPFSDGVFDSISIGSEQDSTAGDEWSGGLMWPAMWNVILTDEEIGLLARGAHPTTIRPQNLVFFAPLDSSPSGLIDIKSGTQPTWRIQSGQSAHGQPLPIRPPMLYRAIEPSSLLFAGSLGLPPIGGFVQGDDARVGNDTTLTATLTSAPKNGNMLIFAVGWHSATATITTPPTGFTLLTTEVGSLASWAWYYRVSDGSETSRSVTISASDTIAIRYNEYEWDNSTPLVSTDEDTTNVSSTTNSQDSGTVTPGRGRNFVVAAIGSSDDVDSQTSQSFSNSFIADDDFIGYGGDTADHRIGRLVNQFGPQTTTHTDSDTGAPMYGAIASFTSLDLPVIESVTTSGSNTAVEPAVVDYPASGIDAGDLLIMLIGNDGSADLPDFPTGDWDDNKLLRTTPSAGGFGMGVSWKIADGTENGGSENVGFSAGVEEWAGAIIHISNWHGSQPPEISTVASENSNDSMAVSLDPSWDAANQGNAWIWFLTGDGGAMNVSSFTTIGAAFPDNQTAYSPGAAAPCAAIATSLKSPVPKLKLAGTDDLAATDPHAELIIGVRGPVSGPVTVDITDVDTDETWDDGSTGLVITGTGFI